MRIKSSTSDTLLELADFDGEYLQATVRSQDHQARMRVYAWSPYSPEPDLGALLDELAESWMGWEGPKVWRSVEGELSLTFRHDGIGQVTLEACLNPRANGGPSWSLATKLTVDPGALGSIAADARRLLGAAG